MPQGKHGRHLFNIRWLQGQSDPVEISMKPLSHVILRIDTRACLWAASPTELFPDQQMTERRPLSCNEALFTGPQLLLTLHLTHSGHNASVT